MTKESTAVIKKKKCRGAVMGALEDNYPHNIAYTVLERVMADAQGAQPHELPAIIAYLEDKKYIRVIRPDEPQVKPLAGSSLVLTAHGIDLMEETLPEDNGIIF